MNAKDVVELLGNSLETAKAGGTTLVPIEKLQLFVAEVDQLITESGNSNVALAGTQLEYYKSRLNEWAASTERAHQFDLEMFRSVISVALAALKTVLLVNGAAAIAMLAFIGNIWATSNGKPIVMGAACALGWYVSGVLTAGAASAFTYLAQAGYGNIFGKDSQCFAYASHFIAMSLVLAAYVIFGRASWLAYTAFTAL